MGFTFTYQQQEHKRLEKQLIHLDLYADTNLLMKLYEDGWRKVFAHGDFSRWSSGLDQLPDLIADDVALSSEVRVGKAEKNINIDSERVKHALLAMRPWRKGPFDVFGVHVDTEWRSDWKWDRVLPHISCLKGRRVLDVGCGSGYHLWRMIGEGADLALGIDPTPLFSLHFASIKRYVPDAPTFLIPTGIDDMPSVMKSFDTVFSMGILYHRREPLEHLYKLKSLLKEGGELVLETLVVDGDERSCLMPEGRYAKMRNVWFIPSVLMLTIWLKRLGFKHIRCVETNQTSIQEQRTTDWMTFESLTDFLDPHDPSKTVEGYPAPKRAVFLATG